MNTPTSICPHISATFQESTFSLRDDEVRLRLLRETDLLQLEWHGGADLRSFYQKQWDNHRKESVLVIVADYNEFPIAQAAIHWLGKPTHPQIPDIQSVRVMETFQGQGIGSRLLEQCEKIVRAESHPRVSLAVALDNEDARRLYERLGYRVTGTPYDDRWSYIDAMGQTIEVSELVTDMMKDL